MTSQVSQSQAGTVSQDATGWSASDFSRSRVMLRLSATALDDIADCTRRGRVSGKGLREIGRSDFSTPAIAYEMQLVAKRLRTDGGVVLMKGLCVNDFSTEDVERLYTGLGLHLGLPLSQSPAGGHLAKVSSVEPRVSPADRGEGRVELHTDRSDFVGLLCLRRAVIGGETVLSSVPKVLSIMRQRHPDLLELLPRGTGAPVTASQKAARDCFDRIANSPSLRVQFQLEPGEILWLDNRQVLRGREAFVNHPDPARARLLYRMQIQRAPRRSPEGARRDDIGGGPDAPSGAPGQEPDLRYNQAPYLFDA